MILALYNIEGKIKNKIIGEGVENDKQCKKG